MTEEVGSRRGRCHCGEVVYLGRGTVLAQSCHCTDCTRWCGGPFNAIIFSDGIHIDEGEDKLTFYRSSEGAERGFCSNCGTNLFWRTVPPGMMATTLGSLDDNSDIPELSRRIFFDQTPQALLSAHETPTLTREETIALFQGAKKSEGADSADEADR